VAGIDLTDLESEKHLAAHIKDLNLLGCLVETVTPFPEGTKVRLRISHAGTNFIAIGKVAHSRPSSGMGIAFTTIEPSRRANLGRMAREFKKVVSASLPTNHVARGSATPPFVAADQNGSQ
jgi:hypothetical protein